MQNIANAEEMSLRVVQSDAEMTKDWDWDRITVILGTDGKIEKALIQ